MSVEFDICYPANIHPLPQHMLLSEETAWFVSDLFYQRRFSSCARLSLNLQLLCIFPLFSPSLTSSSFLQPWGLNSGPQSTTTDLYFYLEAGSHKLPRWPRMYLVGHMGLEVLSSCLSPLRSCYLLSLFLSSWFMEIQRATTCVPSSPHRTPWTYLCLYPMLLFVSFSERGSLLQWSVFTVNLTRFQIT